MASGVDAMEVPCAECIHTYQLVSTLWGSLTGGICGLTSL